MTISAQLEPILTSVMNVANFVNTFDFSIIEYSDDYYQLRDHLSELKNYLPDLAEVIAISMVRDNIKNYYENAKEQIEKTVQTEY